MMRIDPKMMLAAISKMIAETQQKYEAPPMKQRQGKNYGRAHTVDTGVRRAQRAARKRRNKRLHPRGN